MSDWHAVVGAVAQGPPVFVELPMQFAQLSVLDFT